MTAAQDARFMRIALALGERNLGRTWPNPAVGCVIVRDGQVVARGWTQPGGRPHAETEALARAGEAARGATAYVTLEPCANPGHTPPCCRSLVAAGIRRVVVGCIDPDPRVNGQGIANLRAAGIEVVLGCLEQEALRQNLGLYRRIRDGRPMFALKLAVTLDGRIATREGRSRWITGPRGRAEAHRLRAAHDAVLVGSGTAVLDDPRLTCRLAGLEEASPVRIVLDRRLRLAPDSRLARTARDLPVWLFTAPSSPRERRRLLEAQGVEVIALDEPFLPGVAKELARRGITRVLIEGGGTIAAAFLRAGFVDRLHLVRAPRILGGDARPAIGALGLDEVAQAERWVRREQLPLDEDDLCTLEPAAPEGEGCSPAS